MLYVIVDNTWLTDVIFNLFKFDADFVILSLTKYYSAGTAIGGAILSNHEDQIKSIIDWARINSNHVSSYNCNLRERIIRSSSLTTKVIKFMTLHPKIYNVIHSLIDNHVSNSLAKKYFEKKKMILY